MFRHGRLHLADAGSDATSKENMVYVVRSELAKSTHFSPSYSIRHEQGLGRKTVLYNKPEIELIHWRNSLLPNKGSPTDPFLPSSEDMPSRGDREEARRIVTPNKTIGTIGKERKGRVPRIDHRLESHSGR